MCTRNICRVRILQCSSFAAGDGPFLTEADLFFGSLHAVMIAEKTTDQDFIVQPSVPQGCGKEIYGPPRARLSGRLRGRYSATVVWFLSSAPHNCVQTTNCRNSHRDTQVIIMFEGLTGGRVLYRSVVERLELDSRSSLSSIRPCLGVITVLLFVHVNPGTRHRLGVLFYGCL